MPPKLCRGNEEEAVKKVSGLPVGSQGKERLLWFQLALHTMVEQAPRTACASSPLQCGIVCGMGLELLGILSQKNEMGKG